MIHSNNDAAFQKAASMAHRGRHGKIVKLLVDITKEEIQLKQMIHSNNDIAFRYSVGDPSTQGTRIYRGACPIGYYYTGEDVETYMFLKS